MSELFQLDITVVYIDYMKFVRIRMKEVSDSQMMYRHVV